MTTIELILVVLVCCSVAVVAVWRPKWVWVPISALVGFCAFLLGRSTSHGDEGGDGDPEPPQPDTPTPPDHTPEDRRDTKIDVARDDDVSSDLGVELDSLDAEHEAWRERWLRSRSDGGGRTD